MSTPDFLNRLLELSKAIQQIPAPTFEEAKRAEFVKNQFLLEKSISVVDQDPTGNVYACRKGNGDQKPVLLCAHLDTVFPHDTPLTIKEKGSRISAPGIGDNSLAVASLLGILWLLDAEGFHLPYDLWLVATVGEEGLGNLKGMRAVVSRFAGLPQAYIAVEGLSYGGICTQGIGVKRFEIQVNTPGGHSWGDFGIPSAIHEIASLITRLDQIPLSPKSHNTYNVGVIHGGTSINTIAAQASFELDLRSAEQQALERMVDFVKSCVAEAQKPDVRLTLKQIGERPAGSINPEHRLVQAAAKATRAQGNSPRFWIGSTDANIPLHLGYPAICIGITKGGKAHTKEEYIYTHYVEKGMQQLLLLLQALRQ